MATYYRWRKSTIVYVEKTRSQSGNVILNGNTIYYTESDDTKPTLNAVNGKYTLPYSKTYTADDFAYWDECYLGPTETTTTIYYNKGRASLSLTGTSRMTLSCAEGFDIYYSQPGPGTSQGYVYSTSSSAYPNGGVKAGYYYDQRTAVESPTAPTGLTYPNPITTPTVTVSWQAADSNTDYPIDHYTLTYRTEDSGAWNHFGPETANLPPDTTSYQVKIPTGVTQIMLKVQAWDTNNKGSDDCIGPLAPVSIAPTLTVPQMVMQDQPATISWSAIEGADSYTLQRKSSADADWTQVYSGSDTTFTETVGTWTSLQYRVQAVFDGTPGGWATSDPIQIVSASALVISGQDGDLGTLVNDVPYSISSDQTSPTIDVTVEVNGGEYAAFQATSGQTYKVGVLDLPTGTGSIVITASTEVSESPVTVTRTWTYSKTAASFPSAGSVGQLTQQSNVIWPETIAEAVRAGMTPWGGNLSTALNLLKTAALFNRTKQPKYSEVTVSMANVTEGQIVNIPRGGVMVPHYVGKLEYESGLNGAGRRLLVPVECYDQRTWNSNAVNTYANSDIDTWMNGDYKALFPEEIQTAMGATKFYYTPGNNNWTVGILERSIFALSGTELGETYLYVNEEGSTLPISPTLKVAHKNGEKIEQWTRSPFQNVTSSVEILDLTGEAEVRNCSENACGSRPCFTLPNTFSYGPIYVDHAGTIMEEQEYTEAGDWLDVWGNAIPAVKMETGSYVGTGTYGSGNPNKLTFSFAPKMVVVTEYGATGLGASTGMIWNGNPQIGTRSVSVAGSEISWYDSSASNQLNSSGSTYYYAAIG